MIVTEPFDPDHHYYNHVGGKITLEQWAALRTTDCILRQDRIYLPDATDSVLRTVYLGFVDLSVYDARLYGTAIVADGTVTQIQVYDSEEQAFVGHMSHVEANGFGFHCNRCRLDQDHIE